MTFSQLRLLYNMKFELWIR